MNLRKYIAGIFYNIWYKIEYGTRRQELSLISELLDNLNKEWELNNYRITLCYDIYNYANGPIIRINNITSIDNNSMSGIYTYQGSDKLSRIKNVCLSSKSNLIYILFCASDGIGHADRLISLQLPANTLISEN